VGFDFDHDQRWRTLFVGQARTDSPTPFSVADWSSKSDLPQAVWESRIREKINRCNMLIVLVGRHMHTATGVAREIEMARDLNVPAFGVYVDSATSASALPVGLARNRVIRWTWPSVAAAITQMMREGKNRQPRR
jgi:hypothetical protein